MRVILSWSPVLLLCAAPLRADDAAEARKVLDRGIKALGGEDRLGKLGAVTWKGKGQFTAEGLTAEFQNEMSLSGLDQMNWKLDLQIMGRALGGTLVMAGDKGWFRNNTQGRTDDMPKEVAPLFRNSLRSVRLAQQLTPLRDQRYQLSPLGELKVGDRPAVGIKVVEKDRPDLDLYFDKETGLPLRIEARVKEPQGAEEVTHAWYFESYKDFDGVKHFTKLVLRRDDKPTIEMELSEVKREEKLDESIFGKP
jgi:hypothetical protein